MEEEADTGGGSKGKEEELEIIDSSEDTIDRLLNKKKPVVVKDFDDNNNNSSEDTIDRLLKGGTLSNTPREAIMPEENSDATDDGDGFPPVDEEEELDWPPENHFSLEDLLQHRSAAIEEEEFLLMDEEGRSEEDEAEEVGQQGGPINEQFLYNLHLRQEQEYHIEATSSIKKVIQVFQTDARNGLAEEERARRRGIFGRNLLSSSANFRQKILKKYVRLAGSQGWAYVLIDGVMKVIRLCELVIGDIVFLHAGDIIPADIRLISSYGFSVMANNNGKLAKLSCIPHETRSICSFGEVAQSGTALGVVIRTGSKVKLTFSTSIMTSVDLCVLRNDLLRYNVLCANRRVLTNAAFVEAVLFNIKILLDMSATYVQAWGVDTYTRKRISEEDIERRKKKKQSSAYQLISAISLCECGDVGDIVDDTLNAKQPEEYAAKKGERESMNFISRAVLTTIHKAKKIEELRRGQVLLWRGKFSAVYCDKENEKLSKEKKFIYYGKSINPLVLLATCSRQVKYGMVCDLNEVDREKIYSNIRQEQMKGHYVMAYCRTELDGEDQVSDHVQLHITDLEKTFLGFCSIVLPLKQYLNDGVERMRKEFKHVRIISELGLRVTKSVLTKAGFLADPHSSAIVTVKDSWQFIGEPHQTQVVYIHDEKTVKDARRKIAVRMCVQLNISGLLYLAADEKDPSISSELKITMASYLESGYPALLMRSDLISTRNDLMDIIDSIKCIKNDKENPPVNAARVNMNRCVLQ